MPNRRLYPDSVATVVLATRITRSLHRRLQIHSAEHDIPQMTIVAEALREKLAREAGRRPRVRA